MSRRQRFTAAILAAAGPASLAAQTKSLIPEVNYFEAPEPERISLVAIGLLALVAVQWVRGRKKPPSARPRPHHR